MDPVLVTRDLVSRLEASEAAYHEAKLRGLCAEDDNARGVEIARLGDTLLLSIQSRRYNPSLNRAMCFSTEDVDHLDDIVRWLRDRADQFWFDIAPALVDKPGLKVLAKAGLSPVFLLNVVYTVPQEMADDIPAGVRVLEIDVQEQAHDLAVVLVEGFGVPKEALEGMERSVRAEYAAPEWHVYLAFVDGQPASVATLHVDGDVASIDAMATVPGYRRQGCQAALLRQCIIDAAREGCAFLVSQTSPSSTSERNMVRVGFRIAYTKMMYGEIDC